MRDIPVVVVADDSPDARQLISTLLGYRKYRVLEAADGLEALALVNRERPDLLISDLLMPHMDGFELAHRIHSDAKLCATPVIFYTASYHTEEARSLAAECGAQALIMKPAEPEAVYAAVDSVLARRGSPEVLAAPQEFARLHSAVLRDKVAEQYSKLTAARQRIFDLAALGQALSAEHGPMEMMQTFCAQAKDILLVREVGAVLTSENGDTIQLALHCGRDGQTRSTLIGTQPIPAELQRAGTLASGLLEAAGAKAVAAALRFDSAHLREVAAAPIETSAGRYGWLCVSQLLGRAALDEIDEGVIVTMAAQVAVTLERTHRELELREREKSLAHEARAREVAERALQASDTNFRMLFESILDGMMQCSAEGLVRIVNPALAEKLGYQPVAALFGRPLAALCTEPDRAAALFDELEAAGYVRNVELGMQRASGEIVYMLVNARTVRDAAGRIDHYELCTRDISEQRRSRERRRFALQVARTGIWEWDIATGRLTWGDTLSEVFGIPESEAPQSVDELIARFAHPEDRARLTAALQGFKPGDALDIEYRTVLPDGGIRWIAVSGRFSVTHSAPQHVLIGVAVDITERKRLEEQFHQAQKMEAIGQLASGVAHDFNNLLTAIRGYAEFLRDEVTDASQRGDAEQILIASDRAAGLTGQLLAFSRKQVVQRTLVDVNVLVGGMSEMLRRLIGEDVELVPSLMSDIPLVEADAGQIEQVIMNLVVNARDAMPHGGRITIETANVDLDEHTMFHRGAARPGAYVLLSVTDTGTGMDDATKARLFEPFFTTKPRGKGTGLGLASADGIVAQTGGYVWAYSEPGRGATFKVYLPCATRPAEQPALEPPKRLAGGTDHVLLVEDERPIRDVAEKILRRAGYQVVCASTAAEAEALFEAHAIDLLVSDVILPDGTGPALFRRLVASKPELRMLYMSGYTDETITGRGAIDPDAAFLQKPFSSAALVRKVREVLDR